MLGRIKKSFVNFDCKLLKSLYLTFIRPLLEFAVPVWSPFLKSDCDLIERVQHRASKLVPSIRNRNYEDRLKALGLTTLVERRQRGDAIQIYKFMHGMDNFDRDNRFQVVRNQVRGHCFKYHKEIARHQQREGFLFNRTANLWNSLPEHLVNAPTVNSFKANFDCWMSSNQSDRLS
jgi:ribonuclease P/MRP protein subunit RPP40